MVSNQAQAWLAPASEPFTACGQYCPPLGLCTCWVCRSLLWLLADFLQLSMCVEPRRPMLLSGNGSGQGMGSERLAPGLEGVLSLRQWGALRVQTAGDSIRCFGTMMLPAWWRVDWWVPGLSLSSSCSCDFLQLLSIRNEGHVRP